MRNMMIDEQILDDLQIAGYPKLVVTDEVIADIEKLFASRKKTFDFKKNF